MKRVLDKGRKREMRKDEGRKKRMRGMLDNGRKRETRDEGKKKEDEKSAG